MPQGFHHYKEGRATLVADSLDAAWKGRSALKVAWQKAMAPDQDTASLEKAMAARVAEPGLVAASKGDVKTAFAASAKKVSCEYRTPYLAHATMEPMNCVASVTAERCDVWAPTQNQGGVKSMAVRVTGLKPEQVFVHTTYLGGGFGRRFETDFAEEAVNIAKIAGKPVKVVWTREEDIRYDFYRPANFTRIEAGIVDKGQVTSWSHKIVCPSISARVFPGMMKNGIDNAAVEGVTDLEYEVPNLIAEYVRVDLPVPVGFWRSVGDSHNGFIIESFVDELA